MSLTMWADTSAFNKLLNELGEGIEHAVRPAAQAGAQVLYEEVLRNVDRIGQSSGNLRQAIYQAYDKLQSGPLNAAYQIGWNQRKAPHGQLVEFGHIQRYAAYVGKDGKWHTAVRKDAKGKKPGRRASVASKDAYYVQRKGGPVQVAAQPFIRPAIDKMPEAIAAMKAEFYKRIGEA